MRITRSTLRRLIAEESARLLREAAFPKETEGVHGEAPPEDGGGDGISKMLHIMYRGFRPVFIVTDVDANPLGEEAEDVTQQIQPAKSNMTTPELAQAIIDFITDESNSIMYVFDEEMNDSETDDKFETGDYVEHLEGLISSSDEEAGTRGAEMYQRAGMSGEDEDLFEGEEELEEERGTRMLHVTYHGGSYEGGEGFSNVHFIVTDFQANPLGEEAEDVTDEITGREDLDTVALSYALKDWLLSHTDVGYVVDEEMHDPETDDNSTADEYIEHLDGLIAAEEEEAGERGAEMYGRAVDRGDHGDLDEGEEDLDESDYGDKTDPYERGEGDYGKRGRYEKTGLTSSSMIWDPSGEIPLVKSKDARDINTTVNDKIADPDRTHVIRQTILGKPGFQPVAELTIDLEYDRESKRDMIGATINTDDGQTFVGLGNSAVEAIKKAEAQWRAAGSYDAAYARDVEETDAAFARDRDRPGNFLEEGFFDMFKKADDDSDGEDPDVDPLGDSDDAKHSRHMDYKHALKMGGGPDEEGFAIDYDTGRPSPFAAKMFGQPAAGADDIEGADADEDVFGDDDMGRRGAMDDYHHAYKLGGGRDEEGFAADYDTGKKRQFPPARGGISEARWAKLAGILKG